MWLRIRKRRSGARKPKFRVERLSNKHTPFEWTQIAAFRSYEEAQRYRETLERLELTDAIT